MRGNPAEYSAGSIFELKRISTVSIANAAAVSVNFPEAFSSVTFTSTETTETTNKIGNRTSFRGPGEGLPWGYRYLVYDGGYSLFKYEYWTCEFGPGWVGATSQAQMLQSWQAGGNTACWNYAS